MVAVPSPFVSPPMESSRTVVKWTIFADVPFTLRDPSTTICVFGLNLTITSPGIVSVVPLATDELHVIR